MTYNWRKKILFPLIFISSFASSNGCWMEGVDIWALQVGTEILDVHRGDVFNRETRDIDGINSYTFSEGLNGGPYFNVRHSDSRFIIDTNEAYEDYERYETVVQSSVTVNFRCTDGSAGILVFVIQVQDTNNNIPQFLPSNELDYTIFTPTPPGMVITGCFDGIIVEDIDLTTYRIDFTIEENPYFEIAYDASLSTTAKQFIGIITTKSFIRSLPEPVNLTITATDVDLTNDRPHSTTATVTITADTEFEFPEEPVFTQAFYLADYTDSNQLILLEPISLQHGFHELVEFSLEGEYKEYFSLSASGNLVSITTVTPLPPAVLRENQIFLIVRADREHTSGDTATVVIQLPEDVPLEFERAHYEGTIENNALSIQQLILAQGYEGQTVSVEIVSEYASFFSTNVQGNAITLSMGLLTDNIINENNMISLEIVASTEFSIATGIVTLEIIKDDNVTPVFSRPMYAGSYDIETGLTLDQIVFEQGFDETVEVSLEGDYNTLFTINQAGPVVTLNTPGIPPEMFSQQQILLTLQATKPRTVGATATIIITLPAARQLGFEDSTYRGTLQETALSLDPIVLSTGYDENVAFNVLGELSSYFALTATQNRVTITLQTPIPQSIIEENNLIILTVEASGLNAVPTTTSVLVDIIKEDITTPVFSRNIYYGSYVSTSAVNIENINLVQGFDSDVTFRLQGDHAEYFQISNTGNNVVVSLQSNIPEDLIFNQKVLLFNIIADKPLTVRANAAILITFPSELTNPVVLRFGQNTYEARVENNNLMATDIVLSTGYQAGTDFLLTGDLSTHFSLTNAENVVTLSIADSLPIDEIESTFIVLEVEARREQAVSAWTSIVVELVKQQVTSLVFTSPYYQGVYDEENAVLSVEVISLALGYDETVQFMLEGDLASLFTVTDVSNNMLTVGTQSPLSSAVIEQYNNILLAIVATKPGTIDARSAISINIDKVKNQIDALQFDQINYVGSLQNTEITLDPITLIEGYSQSVTFSLHGDLADYFTLSPQAAGAVGITLSTEIPDAMIPANNIIVLEIRASDEQSIPAYATIVLEVVVQSVDPLAPQLNFDATYYTGSYTTAAGLTMDSAIVLTQGYDHAVTFALEGDHAQWFSIVQTGNSIQLTVAASIPAAVLVSNRQLVFVIAALREGSVTARSTIVITLTDDYTTDAILGFDQINYVGSLTNTEITLDPITLIEGYSQSVTFSLHGDLAEYFTLSPQGAGVVGITLSTAIPDAMIPANSIIVLEIRASDEQSVPAYATIVLEVVVQSVDPSAPQLNFDATYYTGSFTTAAGLTMDSAIVLTQGYDQAVTFALEGDHAQWFSIVQTGNSIQLTVAVSIPAAVLVSNRQLVFVIAALREGSVTARSTIVITLTDDYMTDAILGFDQINYVGSLQNTEITLDPITLIEGYSQRVTFSLHGDLAEYFTLSPQGAGVVGITLSTAIPDVMIPANSIIVLEIRASDEQSIPAYATIILEVVVQSVDASAAQLNFDATYYTGSYTTAAGLTMDSAIVLTQGYDHAVTFALEGDHAQWFSIVQTGNSIQLTVAASIPAAVLVSNRQLVFVITALREGSVTARSTIVITLTDDYTTDAILGFDQINYVGSLQNTEITLDQITLIEGYSQSVTFSLHGDLAEYFTLLPQGAGAVGITLSTTIPDATIPANSIIVLEIRASDEQSVPAYATIVLEVVVQSVDSSAPQLNFDATYYTGSYTNAAGLTMDSAIVLTQGYDQAVTFALEGDHAQWFSIVQTGNSIQLTVAASIPATVLVSNRQLVFVIAALREGSVTARSTIVITLTDDYTTDVILGFDQINYVGSLQNTEITLDPITLVEGYSQSVTFSLHGDLAEYFTLSPQGAGVVGITLSTAIPDAMIPANSIIVLEIRASDEQSVPAYATIVLEVVVQSVDPSAPQLNFDATYYTGSYTTAAGLTMDSAIVLTQGYDQAVTFALEGDHAQWFSIVQTGNSIQLTVATSIPAAVLVSNRQLVFVIAALREGSVTARSTIVITLTDDYTTDAILGFDQINYVGSLQNTEITLDPITLIEGYSQSVTFSLHGDLAEYFTLSPQGAGVVGITLSTAIPDAMIPANSIIVLEIRASDEQSIPAYATIILEVVVQSVDALAPQLNFDATYYTGSYTTAAGLTMDSAIVLTQGYDHVVTFALEGDHAQWFSIVQTGNSIQLTVAASIPAAVLVSNRQLVFVIAALREGSVTARSTIVITLTDDYTTDAILGFDQINYVGSLQNTEITLDPITLIEGYSQSVTFSLHGDLAEYFTLSPQGAGAVGITLSTTIPDAMIPANSIIVLEIRASDEQSVPAYATIVLEVVVQSVDPSAPQLNFDATYYTGSYTTAAGLTMDSAIVLTQGYDQAVTFALEGDHAQWFSIVQTGNSIQLTVAASIPAAVLVSNRQLVFVIAALREGSVTARSTIVITLTDDYTTDAILGFDQINYVGSLQNTEITLDPITLIEGYSQSVTFSLHGDLAEYFTLSPQGAGAVGITLSTTIPDAMIPANSIIVLEIRASDEQSVPAYATIVLEVVVQSVDPSAPQLNFDATYYTGSYTTAAGLTMDSAIVLTQGYDQAVTFALEGDHAQWFSIVQTGNSIQLTVAASIPAAVLVSNRQLVFVIAALREGSVTARSTIVITLTDDYTTDAILGFDQINYVGSLQNTEITLDPITLIEGYSQSVTFSLHGDLAEYFTLSPQGAGVVGITLSTAIPDAMIPANSIIVLEIRASDEQSIPAYATIILEVVVQSVDALAPQLNFDATYYTGSYTTAAGLTMDSAIVLTQGYDHVVTFALEGDHAQWFSIVQTGNSIQLTVAASIPAAVLVSNRQLVFVIAALREGSVTARSTIVITLTDDYTTDAILGFDQINYVGSLQNTEITLDPITLIEGYSQSVTFSLHGDLAEYFTLSPQGAGAVGITLSTTIPDAMIPANSIIVLEIRASDEQSVPAYATIVLEVVVQSVDPSAPQLNFDATYYTGSYTTAAGLTMDSAIVLTQGYDQAVTFALEGDHAQWFSIVQTGNSIQLTVAASIPAAVLVSNRQLVFVIAALREGSVTARSTIVITLTDDYTTDAILGFDQINYVGSLQNTEITLDPITLIEGYSQSVTFSLHGDLAEYFTLSPQGAGAVGITLSTTIPDAMIPANSIIVLEIRASDEQSVPAYATIVLEVVVQSVDPSAPQLNFDATYYTGSYTTAAGLTMDSAIVLTQGYDQAVTFALEGDHAQWFSIVQTGNSIQLTVAASIPAAVLVSNRQLVFVIAALREGSVTARSTIVITLTDDYTTDAILGFDQINYVGSLQNTEITLDPITLIEGYSQSVTFSLHGDLAEYFTLSPQGAGVVGITLSTAIPDAMIPANSIIVLEIRASDEQSIPAYATIILEVIVQSVDAFAPQLNFDATYYTGSYTTAAGLTMDSAIVLTQGYDQAVTFALEGDHAQWFSIVQTGNSVQLTVAASIPAAVLVSNRQLVFVIAALREGSVTARSTIVITITDDYTTDVILGFDQINYVGSLQNTEITLDPITLIEGYSQSVTFSLHGDLAEYFTLSPQGAGVVGITLPTAIPDVMIPANSIIVLEIRASDEQSVPAYATIVLEVVVQSVDPSAPQLNFDATYYTGSYTTAAGLTMDSTIVLTQGYDQAVTFALEGDHAQWFSIVQTGNSIQLTVAASIPAAVLVSNRQLVFVIAALREGSVTARSTIVITLTNDYTIDAILGFDQINYVGSLQNTEITLDPITLIEGYSQSVTFSLHGDLAEYFTLSPQGAGVVGITLSTAIPDVMIPTNSIIVLEIRASDEQSVPAYATIVLEVVVQSVDPSAPQLNFDATYYTGSYTTTAGLTMDSAIVLTQGYDQAVTFALEGDHAQWFNIVQTGNSIQLTVAASIPAAVLVSNRQLVFVIAALREGSVTARSTIVITITDDYTTDAILGFDQINYVGSLQNTEITLDPITLIEGYSQSVTFSLHGDLAEYFTLSPQGAGVVGITLSTAIPDAMIPANSFIVLEIRASDEQSVPAYATIVLEVVVQSVDPSAPQLNFDATYYTGSYTTAAGLTMDSAIVLTQGYDQAVTFALEGDHAQWFSIVQTGNSIQLTVAASIPAAVLVSNRQLVFVIAALREGSVTARSTIVITLTDDYTIDAILGFDQINYVGSLQNTEITLDPITLIEGYSQSVTFSLHGDLAEYFTLSPQGAGVVGITLSTAIPDVMIPTNSIIVLEIRASDEQSVPAYATIVLEVVVQSVDPSAPQLNFDATYYTGSYTTTAGLTMDSAIVLTQGYDQAVTFALEGDHAQWFNIVQTGNSIQLTVAASIPAAVLVSNRQLVFVIAALREGSVTARSTIVITLTDDYTTDAILGFDQINYVGSLQNTEITLDPITLIEGYSQSVTFSLHGDLAEYFTLSPQGAGVVGITLSTAIPDAMIPANSFIVLEIRASDEQSVPAYATIVLEVVVQSVDPSAPQLNFDATYYTGSYTTAAGLTMDSAIVLTQGYDQAVTFALEGDHAQWFSIVQTGNSIQLTVAASIPAAVLVSNRQLVFVIAALREGSVTARSTIVITITDDYTTDAILGFDQINYVGSLQNTEITLDPITLIEGYSQSVTFSLHGDLAEYFTLSPQGAGVVGITLSTAIPDAMIPANSIIVLEIRASDEQSMPAYASIVLGVVDVSQIGDDVSFEKFVYEGIVQLNTVQHESIVISNDNETNVQLHGEYSSQFVALTADGVVTVQASGSVTLPDDVTQVVLELHAAEARAVLLLNIVQSDVPVIPSVTFSSPMYVVHLNIVQTGHVGQVHASTSTGEAVTYSLIILDEQLQARLSVNNEGELHLSAPANSGIYLITVIATTVITRTEGVASIYMTVDAITVCGGEIVMPPLIMLERDEEEAHNDLVVLNTNQYEGCQFSLTNRWPLNQDWLYVDHNGLHVRSIDREHESIAFMALSQVQVELVLHCESDNSVRTKRSQRTDWLGPYDYGTNKWVLTDSISYNARRSLVNLIVNDINDNAPIFIGKELEPIAVGYPIEEIKERILPRSLAELQATDADIGINAELKYWSSETVLAVAPTTGFVHVRNGAILQDNQVLVVSATDQNGEGLTGEIQLVVKLLYLDKIAVVTVNDAFLNDEETVLSQLSDAVGYEIKALRSVVINNLEQNEEELSRNKRDTSTTGASLQLYVYGLEQREPVLVDRLTTDINNNAAVASIISTVSLEDHLDPAQIIISERDIGLLVATIVLSVLLFIIIVLIAIWYFLRWRKNRNYDEFSDENSLASKRDSVEQLPKPESMPMPRLNIEELKRSERRLQDMLNSPIEEISVEQLSPRREPPQESILDMSPPEPSSPIVIQSIDKLKDAEDTDDEFGEVSEPRRKSVVTFNENVEKIIHVEDDMDTISSASDYEIYRL